MARKTLEDFNGDCQAYADYLESAECANDDGYDVIADSKGNVYEPTDGDWTKGHGHRNDNTNYNRTPERKESKGRPWKNPWLKYCNKLYLTSEEMNFLQNFNDIQNLQTDNCKKIKTLK